MPAVCPFAIHINVRACSSRSARSGTFGFASSLGSFPYILVLTDFFLLSLSLLAATAFLLRSSETSRTSTIHGRHRFQQKSRTVTRQPLCSRSSISTGATPPSFNNLRSCRRTAPPISRIPSTQIHIAMGATASARCSRPSAEITASSIRVPFLGHWK